MKYIIVFSLFLLSCASVQPLNGGQKDEIPPKVLSVSPDSASINIANKDFEFTFDEYVKTTKLNDLLIISPNQKIKPIVKVKGKKVILSLQDELIPNTTYTFQFNGSIIDINEGNALTNYSYVISTGAYLDSLEHRGVVRDITTNKPCKECNVQLYKAAKNDSVILTSKPDYLAKTDEAGIFNFQNLPNDTFTRIVLSDQNNNLVLDQDELVSLSDNVIINNNKKDTILVFPTPSTEKLKAKLIKSQPGIIKIETNKPINKREYKLFINDSIEDYKLNTDLNTVSLFYTPKMDTSYITLLGLGDTINITSILPISKLNYTPILELSNQFPTKLQLSTPIKSIDTSNISLLLDSLKTPFTLEIQNRTDLILTHKKYSKTLEVVIDSGAILDVFGKSNKSDTLRSTPTTITSTINLTFNINSDSLNYIIQLLDDKGVISRTILKKTTTKTYNNLKSGLHKVKIVKDINKNGIWDTGNIFTRKSPEAIQFSEPFEVRENWDKELIINIL